MKPGDWRAIARRMPPQCTAPVPNHIADLTLLLCEVLIRQEIIMSNQTDLNDFAARLEAAVTVLATELANLQAQPAETPLDWTAANAAFSHLQSLEAPSDAPAEPAPADAAPAESTDGTATA